MHSDVNIVNGYQMLHWTLGDVYYITDKKDSGVWLCEDKDKAVVEEYAKTLEA
ncbi:hypothetical protein [Paenibacillus sp. FSL H3-0333]|uniref:hypothetical protein n=1 Tax=Paenibacillus sp. FSL H3-0333 TaxID=2921373 RepID=UPI0030FD03EB